MFRSFRLKVSIITEYLCTLSLSTYAERLTLDETCVVSMLNRTVQATADGSWQLDNVPTFMDQICMPEQIMMTLINGLPVQMTKATA